MKQIFISFFLSLVFIQSNVKKIRNNKNINWLKIESQNFNILFHKNFYGKAQLLANTLEYIYTFVPFSLNVKPKKTSVFIAKDKARSNGSADILNFIYFLPIPSQYSYFLGLSDNIVSLCIHEFRHICQFVNLKKASVFPLMPLWLFEGDAVYAETVLTDGGRGRIPYWTLLYKVNLLEKGIFPYYKNYFGSFKDFTPDHYVMGYLFNCFLRKKYGFNIIKDIFSNVKNCYEPFFAFERTIKRLTKKNVYSLYYDFNIELKKIWSQQINDIVVSESQKLYEVNEFVYHLNPKFIDDNSIITFEYGINKEPKFVKINFDHNLIKKPPPLLANISKTLINVTNLEEGSFFSISNNKLVWSEVNSDLRWATKQVSSIKCYDLISKKLVSITKKGFYKAPCLSSNGKYIVSVKIFDNCDQQLVIHNVYNKQTVFEIPNNSNVAYFNPIWGEYNKSIIVIEFKNSKKALVEIDLPSLKKSYIIPFESANISNPFAFKKYIFYNAAYNGIDNVFVINKLNNKRYQVTSRKYGGFNAVVSNDQKHILFNDFTKNGIVVKAMPFNCMNWVPIENIKNKHIEFFIPFIQKEKHVFNVKNIPEKNYNVLSLKSYVPNSNFFPHNYTPVSFDNYNCSMYEAWSPTLFIGVNSNVSWVLVNQLPIYKSFTFSAGEFFLKNFALKKQNNKNIFFTNHNINHEFFKLSYQKYYCIFDIGFSRYNYVVNDNVSISKFDSFDFAVRLPLAFSKLGYRHLFAFGLLNKYKIYQKSINPFFSFLFKRNINLCKRSIYPKFGQSIKLLCSLRNFDTFQFSALFFFPGFFNNHSFSLFFNTNFQKYVPYSHAVYMPNYNILPNQTGNLYYFDNKFVEFKLMYSMPLLYSDLFFIPSYLFSDLFVNLGNRYFDNSLKSIVQDVGINFWFVLQYMVKLQFGTQFKMENYHPKVNFLCKAYINL